MYAIILIIVLGNSNTVIGGSVSTHVLNLKYNNIGDCRTTANAMSKTLEIGGKPVHMAAECFKIQEK